MGPIAAAASITLSTAVHISANVVLVEYSIQLYYMIRDLAGALLVSLKVLRVLYLLTLLY